MSLKGSVVGTAEDSANVLFGGVGYTTADHLGKITFNLALAISGDSIDLELCVFNYWDNVLGVTALTLDTGTPTAGDWSYDLVTGTGSILSGTDEAVIDVYLPATSDVSSYSTFTVQINPPTGASITLQRTIGPIANIMTLN
jgi:hypothetical protein